MNWMVKMSSPWTGEQFDLDVRCLTYASPKNIALELLCEDGPYGMATINTEVVLPSHHVAIKNYSENEGMVDALLASGVISGEPALYIASGFATIPVYELSAEFIREMNLA